MERPYQARGRRKIFLGKEGHGTPVPHRSARVALQKVTNLAEVVEDLGPSVKWRQRVHRSQQPLLAGQDITLLCGVPPDLFKAGQYTGGQETGNGVSLWLHRALPGDQ